MAGFRISVVTAAVIRPVMLAAALAAEPAPVAVQAPADAAAVARGAYLFRAAGCFTCHTDIKNKGAPLAGGRALKTPFGTFYSPNITPHRNYGIGAWSDADFLRALRRGEAPDGRNYYPVFPYAAYTGMTRRDALDLKAYLFAQPPVAWANRPHDLDFPFGIRMLARIWAALFFDPGEFAADPNRSPLENRGAYLVRHLGHCAECHSPRGWFGVLDSDRYLGGNPDGPDGKKVPNITPHRERGIGTWRDSDVTFFLKTGIRPDGDVAGGAMTDVIEHGTTHLTDSDRQAIAIYISSLKPISSP